jgi:hypothetical protein
MSANLVGENLIHAKIPEGTTHYFINLIDENSFLVSYPPSPDYATLNKTKEKFAKFAIPIQ